MDYDLFIQKITKLALSRLAGFTAEHMAAYWELLEPMRYLDEVLTNAPLRAYNRPMPTALELMEDHKSLCIKKEAEKAALKYTDATQLPAGKYKGERVGGIPKDIFEKIRRSLK